MFFTLSTLCLAPVLAAAIPPLLAAGGSIGAGLLNRSSSRKQWDREVEYNQKFWEQNNKYNSPQEQMKRLQAAGLNPNLVYGGSPGQTAGQSEMQKTPDMQSDGTRYIDPQGPMDMLSAYNDYNIKQAQTDNVKANTDLTEERTTLEARKAYNELIKGELSEYEAELAKETLTNRIELAHEQVRKARADAEYTLSQNERADVMLASNVTEAVERVIASRAKRQLTNAEIQRIKTDTRVLEAQAKLADMNLPANSPAFVQVIANLVKALTIRK
jgi:hypothetical protein